jgi:hypothetical protein
VGLRSPSTQEEALAVAKEVLASAQTRAALEEGGSLLKGKSGSAGSGAGVATISPLHFARYAMTASGAHSLATRWRHSAPHYDALAAAGTLPFLAPIASPAVAHALAREVCAQYLVGLQEEEGHGGVRGMWRGWTKGCSGGSAGGVRPVLAGLLDASSAAHLGLEEKAELKKARSRAINSASTRAVMVGLQRKSHFSLAQLEALKATFAAASASTNGTLDRFAFADIMASQMPGLDRATVDKLFNSFDADASGSISFSEFVNGAARLVVGTVEEKLHFLRDLGAAEGGGAGQQHQHQHQHASLERVVQDLTAFLKRGVAECEEVYTRALKAAEEAFGGGRRGGGASGSGGGEESFGGSRVGGSSAPSARPTGSASAQSGGGTTQEAFSGTLSGSGAFFSWAAVVLSRPYISLLRLGLVGVAKELGFISPSALAKARECGGGGAPSS